METVQVQRKQVSAAADRPARRGASRPLRCTQMPTDTPSSTV